MLSGCSKTFINSCEFRYEGRETKPTRPAGPPANVLYLIQEMGSDDVDLFLRRLYPMDVKESTPEVRPANAHRHVQIVMIHVFALT